MTALQPKSGRMFFSAGALPIRTGLQESSFMLHEGPVRAGIITVSGVFLRIGTERFAGMNQVHGQLTCPGAAYRCSLRMRGNRLSCPFAFSATGSIPAYAGEPNSSSKQVSPPQVYPRVCGGTQHVLGGTAAVQGLSPRMRGNHDIHDLGKRFNGSIPAYAGEPCL